jgi:hypothetical protein
MMLDGLDDDELGILTTTQDEELGILKLLEDEEELLDSPVIASRDESELAGQLDSQRMFELRGMMI